MSTTTKRPLKRLSLLQSPSSQSPQPSPALYSSSNVSQWAKRGSLTESNAFENALQSPASTVSSPTSRTGFPKASRRQSSIYYVSRDRELEREQRATDSTSPEERQSSMLDLKHEERPEKTSASEIETIDLTEPPVEAITLAEKHADLLRFIAQKESKCLELRSQLSAEEAELAALKCKWERIVTRSSRAGSATSAAFEPDGAVAVFGGLRGGMQGVSRLLAQLGDIGVNSSNTSSDAESSHASHSSISTNFTSSSGMTHVSHSSVSSFGIAEEDPSELMKTQSFNRNSTRNPWPISTASYHGNNPSTVRRRPFEPSSPSSSPSPTTPYSGGPFGSTHTLPPSATIKISPLQAPKQAKAWQPRHSKRASSSEPGSNYAPGAAPGSFPPVSSIPGASAAPLVNWVDSVSKKFAQQPTSQLLQKRASTLLTDASNTFFAAWASPSKVAFSPQETRVASPILGCLPSPSLLDDDSDLTMSQYSPITKALEPDRPSPVLKPCSSPRSRPVTRVSTAGKIEATPSEADSDEWNW